MTEHYLETIYNTTERPVTTYPDQLAAYLIERFHIFEGARLLDVGCGRGDFLNGFLRHGIDAIGIDGAERVEEHFIGGINLETDALPFPDESVDVCFSKSVMEHLHNPEKMLTECYRVLKPGGRIIAMVPDWHTCMYIYYDDHTHVQPYTATGLRDCMRMYGFQNVQAEQFYQLPVVWKYPAVKIICRMLQLLGPVKKISKGKFYRFSRELILLAEGTK